MVQNYRDLSVWQKAMSLTDQVFDVTANFPAEQKFVLVSQMQRSALSIPSNIAEGRSRHSQKDFIYHINIARGSLAELETQIILSHKRGYIRDQNCEALLLICNEITRMLFGLRSKLEKPNQNAVTLNLEPVT